MPKNIVQDINTMEMSSADGYDSHPTDSPPTEVEYDTSSNTDWDPVDFWLGKKYFDFETALLCSTVTGVTKTWVDNEVRRTNTETMNLSDRIQCRVTEMTKAYPYVDALQRLRRSVAAYRSGPGYTDVENNYGDLMILVGAILRRGNQEDRQSMVQIVRNLSPLASNASRLYVHVPLSSGDVQVSSNGVTRKRQKSGPELSPKILAASASALKEYGDQIGSLPVYDVEEVPQHEQNFKAILTFKGHKFEGEGRTKKLAQHQAAVVACRELRINLRGVAGSP